MSSHGTVRGLGNLLVGISKGYVVVRAYDWTEKRNVTYYDHISTRQELSTAEKEMNSLSLNGGDFVAVIDASKGAIVCERGR